MIRPLLAVAVPALVLLAGLAAASSVATAPLAAPAAAAPVAPALAAPALAARTADASGVYRVDPVHSSLVFRVKHSGVSWFYGRFNGLAGEITLDEAHPEKSAVNFTVQTESVDTGNAKRDQHLRSPDFFNAEEFPEITFKSEKVTGGKDGALRVAGTLTLHGESKPVELDVETVGLEENPRGGMLAGWEATFMLNRAEFGVGESGGGLGDDVRVTISVEARKDG
jgi:polyisoprenoid-binding protein YceI